jgi:hypothetical protein
MRFSGWAEPTCIIVRFGIKAVPDSSNIGLSTYITRELNERIMPSLRVHPRWVCSSSQKVQIRANNYSQRDFKSSEFTAASRVWRTMVFRGMSTWTMTVVVRAAQRFLLKRQRPKDSESAAQPKPDAPSQNLPHPRSSGKRDGRADLHYL